VTGGGRSREILQPCAWQAMGKIELEVESAICGLVEMESDDWEESESGDLTGVIKSGSCLLRLRLQLPLVLKDVGIPS
jgi:hypothetical protein